MRVVLALVLPALAVAHLKLARSLCQAAAQLLFDRLFQITHLTDCLTTADI